jgi:hypothetical protein
VSTEQAEDSGSRRSADPAAFLAEMRRDPALLQALAECLEEADTGRSLDQILRAHPAEAFRLRPYLELAQSLAEPASAHSIGYSQGFRAFLEAVDGARRDQLSAPAKRRSRFAIPLAAAMLVLGLLFIPSPLATAAGPVTDRVTSALRSWGVPIPVSSEQESKEERSSEGAGLEPARSEAGGGAPSEAQDASIPSDRTARDVEDAVPGPTEDGRTPGHQDNDRGGGADRSQAGEGTKELNNGGSQARTPASPAGLTPEPVTGGGPEVSQAGSPPDPVAGPPAENPGQPAAGETRGNGNGHGNANGNSNAAANNDHAGNNGNASEQDNASGQDNAGNSNAGNGNANGNGTDGGNGNSNRNGNDGGNSNNASGPNGNHGGSSNSAQKDKQKEKEAEKDAPDPGGTHGNSRR